MYTLAIVDEGGDNPGMAAKYFLVGADYYSLVVSADTNYYIFDGANMETYIIDRDEYSDLAFTNNDINYFLSKTNEIFLLEIPEPSKGADNILFNDIFNPFIFSMVNKA